MNTTLIEAAKHGTLVFGQHCMMDRNTGRTLSYYQSLDTYIELLQYVGINTTIDLIKTLDKLGHETLAEGIDKYLSSEPQADQGNNFLSMGEKELRRRLKEHEENQEFEVCAYLRDLLALKFPKR